MAKGDSGGAPPPPDEASIAQAIEACRRGERDAFATIVTQYERLVFALIIRMVGNEATAADLTQEAFLRAFRGLGRFRAGAPFRPWLLRIARNIAIDHLRSSRRAPPMDVPEPGFEIPDAAQPGIDEMTDRRRELRRVEAAIQELRPTYREALVMHVLEGLSYDEMHRITGYPVTTLKIRVVRARAALRKVLGRTR